MLRLNTHRAPTERDITLLLRQLATLVTAGIPLTHSMDILEQTQSQLRLRLLICLIKQHLRTGKSLHEALQKHPKQFSTLTCQLVQVGEQTGKLDTQLVAIADHHEHALAQRAERRQSLFYPCLVSIVALLVMLSLLLWVIPGFETLFQDKLNELPALTRGIFACSHALRYQPWVLLIPLSIGILCHYHAARLHIEKWPGIRTYWIKIALMRFTRLLSLTLSSGLPIMTALQLAEDTCPHTHLRHEIRRLRQDITQGLALHAAMQRLTLFPLLLIQLIKIGEESGKLTHMLDQFTQTSESEIAYFFKQLHRLLEPLIMVVLGVLIGGLVIGMYLPIFKLGSVI